MTVNVAERIKHISQRVSYSLRERLTPKYEVTGDLRFQDLHEGSHIINQVRRHARPYGKIDDEMVIDTTVDLIMGRGGYTVVIAGDQPLKIRYREKKTGAIRFSTDYERYVFKPDAQDDKNLYTLYDPSLDM